MKIKILICILFISSLSYGQEIGSVKNGNYFVKILKLNDQFSCVYSDIISKTFTKERSFSFPNIDTLYAIVMNGFEQFKDHQIIVQTNKDTIVKFEFKNIKGRKMLKIIQNNMLNKSFGSSTFFSKAEITQLFGEKLD